MATYSNMQLEKFAVHAVTAATFCHPLMADIPTGDKGISFDGHIDVMKDTSERRDAFIGKVAVQVKGTGVKDFSGKIRKFSLELDHYRNFYKTGGAVLFVVEVDEKAKTKIFYKQLLPLELKFIIKDYGHQKERTIELRELDRSTIYLVCKDFLLESRMQGTSLIDNNPFKIDAFTSFRMTSLTFNPETDTDLEEHDFTCYGVVENFYVPIGMIKIVGEITNDVETLIIDGKEHKEINVEIEINKKNVIFTFENSLEIKVFDDNKFSFDIKKFISVETQLKILPVLIAFLDGKKIIFKNAGHTFTRGTINDPTILAKVNKLYENFLNLGEAYSIMNVDIKTAFINETPDLQNQIKLFVDVVVNKDLSNVNNDAFNEAGFKNFELGGLFFLFYMQSDQKNHFINAFSEEVFSLDSILEERDENDLVINKCPTSIYIKMEPHELIRFVNLDFKTMLKSFERINPIMGAFQFINTFCLNCVTAYDTTNRLEFLYLADAIYSLHKGGLIDQDENIIRINQLQIRKRINGNFTNEEIKELVELKMNAVNDDFCFCTSVLLEAPIEAQLYFDKLPDEVREAYKEYPMYRLYKELLEPINN